MKTRICSLPLVVLASLLWGNTVSAQIVSHQPLFAYFNQIPESPAFPDDHTLVSTSPEQFEEHSELNALEKNLEDLSADRKVNPETNSGAQLATQQSSVSDEAHYTSGNTADRLHDTVLAALKIMQTVRGEFKENFNRLENTFNRNLDRAIDASHKQQSEHPCGSDAECQSEQARELNTQIVAATREKVKGEEYLLSVYLTRVKPAFRALDQMLGSIPSSETGNAKLAKVIKNAQEGQLQLLTDVIERIKLERVTISNCARLAQQYKKN